MTLCSFILGAGAVTVASGLLFAKYMGFFNKIVVKDIKLAPSYIIYTRYQGSYKRLMPAINSVKQDFGKFCTTDDALPRLAPSLNQLKTFGIYYDDPSRIMDENLSRAIIGTMITISDEVSEYNLLELFEKMNSNSVNKFHFAKFSEPATGFGSVFPLLNVLSIFYAVIRGYPIIKEYGVANKIFSKSRFSVEIYDRHEKTLTIVFPYEGNLEQLFLSGAEQPPYHDAPQQHCD